MELIKVELFGRKDIQVFKNRPKSIIEVLQDQVAKNSDKIALVDEAGHLTFEQLDRYSTNLAGYLQKEMGVKKGDRVAILIGNRIEFPLFVYAIAKIGAILVPINIRLAKAEVDFILHNSEPTVVAYEEEFVETVEEILKESTALQGIKKINVEQLDSIYENNENDSSFELTNIDDEDSLFIMYTSGTTGRPKGAIVSHINVIHSILNYQKIFQTDSTLKTIIAVPIYHITGLVAQFLHLVYVGGTSYLMKRYQNEKYLKLVLGEKVNFLFNVPTIFVMLASTDEFKKHSFDFVKKVAYGGSPIYLQTLQTLKEAFPNAKLHNAYGATETTSPTTLMPLEYPDSKAPSVGKAVYGAEVKIINQNGEECGPNEIGELYIKGPMVIKGYWNNEKANEESFEDGFWKSGDIGVVDEDGFYYIYDRKKDVINRGGEKVFSVEVENVLKRFPGIVEAAVVGVPDEVFGERVKAFVVGEKINQQLIEELKSYCHDHLAKYKVPEYFEVLESLPKNAAGKVMKEKLRAQVSSGSN